MFEKQLIEQLTVRSCHNKAKRLRSRIFSDIIIVQLQSLTVLVRKSESIYTSLIIA